LTDSPGWRPAPRSRHDRPPSATARVRPRRSARDQTARPALAGRPAARRRRSCCAPYAKTSTPRGSPPLAAAADDRPRPPSWKLGRAVGGWPPTIPRLGRPSPTGNRHHAPKLTSVQRRLRRGGRRHSGHRPGPPAPPRRAGHGPKDVELCSEAIWRRPSLSGDSTLLVQGHLRDRREGGPCRYTGLGNLRPASWARGPVPGRRGGGPGPGHGGPWERGVRLARIEETDPHPVRTWQDALITIPLSGEDSAHPRARRRGPGPGRVFNVIATANGPRPGRVNELFVGPQGRRFSNHRSWPPPCRPDAPEEEVGIGLPPVVAGT